MYYEITRAFKPGKPMTRSQISSSYFSEEPRVGVFTLRRGSAPLKLSEASFKLCERDIKRGLMSHSLVVTARDDDGIEIWKLVDFNPRGFPDLKQSAGKAVEAEVQKDLDSGKESLESLQADVVPSPELISAIDNAYKQVSDDLKASELEHIAQETEVAESVVLAQESKPEELMFSESKPEDTTPVVAESLTPEMLENASGKRKGRKAKKENE